MNEHNLLNPDDLNFIESVSKTRKKKVKCNNKNATLIVYFCKR